MYYVIKKNKKKTTILLKINDSQSSSDQFVVFARERKKKRRSARETFGRDDVGRTIIFVIITMITRVFKWVFGATHTDRCPFFTSAGL